MTKNTKEYRYSFSHEPYPSAIVCQKQVAVLIVLKAIDPSYKSKVIIVKLLMAFWYMLYLLYIT